MNIRIILLSLLLNIGCSNQKEKTIIKKINIIESLKVDSFDAVNAMYESKELSGELKYTIEGKIDKDLDDDGIQDFIQIENYKGWTDTEPSDFRKIVIHFKDNYELKNAEGWSKVSKMKVNNSLTKHSKLNNDYFVSLDIGLKYPVLVFFGYWYDSKPGYITIVSVDNKEPEIIFNKQFDIQEVVKVKNKNYYKLIGIYDTKYHELVFKNGQVNFEIIQN